MRVPTTVFGVLVAAAAVGAQFRSGAQVVAVHVTVTVTDAEGRLVPDLTRDAFRVFDNGTPVEISTFSNTAQTITVALMLDMSGSMQERFVQARDSTFHFIDALLPWDRAVLGSFGHEIAISPMVTDDKEILRRVAREELWPGGATPQAVRSVTGLHAVAEAVREYPGRKTLIVVSAGFAVSDRMGGRPDVASEADMLGKRAAQANAVLYSLHLDVSFLQAFSSPNAARELQTVFRNSQILARGLEQFTATGGGSLITVPTGPDSALQRLLRETSAFYLVGVEPLPEHRDGELHRIQVRVSERGATVRARTSVVIPKPSGS